MRTHFQLTSAMLGWHVGRNLAHEGFGVTLFTLGMSLAVGIVLVVIAETLFPQNEPE